MRVTAHNLLHVLPKLTYRSFVIENTHINLEAPLGFPGKKTQMAYPTKQNQPGDH